MGIIRLGIWGAGLAFLLVLAFYVVTVAYVFNYEEAVALPKADAIVVLGGNTSRNGALYGSTATRVATGIKLYKAGVAPLIVMTGGGEPRMGDDMAEEAIRAGIPKESVLIENRSESTVQNALFTSNLTELTPETSVLIVTHRYHLLRSWASFRWAGFKDVSYYAADPDAEYSLDHSGIKKEAFKWPVNVFRASLASVFRWLGAPQEAYAWFLK